MEGQVGGGSSVLFLEVATVEVVLFSEVATLELVTVQ